MKQVYIFTIIFISISQLFTSCELINPDEKIPGYIYIDTAILQTYYPTEGSNSHKITDIWVNVDGNFQGIYELPAKFPILETGKHTYTFRAGVKNNGISASRAYYPFYKFYNLDTTLNENQKMILKPKFQYDEEKTVFELIEDFEDPFLTFENMQDTFAEFNRSTVDAFERDYSGLIVLDSLHSTFQYKTIDSLFLPTNQKEVFIEMDYKTNLDLDFPGDNVFTVGFYYRTYSQLISEKVIYLNSTNGKWKKIYIDLTSNLGYHSDALFFYIFIGAKKTAKHPKVEIGIDNLKIIRRTL